MGGHVAAGISGYGEFAGQIKSGKLRALGISADKRVPGIDIPKLKEQGVDVEMVNWRAVFAAAGITDAQKKELVDVVGKQAVAWKDGIVQRLNNGVAALLRKAKVKTVHGRARFRDGTVVRMPEGKTCTSSPTRTEPDEIRPAEAR